MTSPTSAVFGPYSSAVQFFETDVSWVVDEDDKLRIRAYELYEKMYWNEPGWCKLHMRGNSGDNDRPIYLPSSSKIIEAIKRFLALGLKVVVEESSEGDKTAAQSAIDDLFKRESLALKFSELIRGTLKLGDYLWHVTADPKKDTGTRISVHLLDPANYFPINDDPEYPARVTGCHLVEVIDHPSDDKKQIAKRQTYRKVNGKVFSELSYWEVDAWDDRVQEDDELKAAEDIGDLPTWKDLEIKAKALPVYHFKNLSWGDHPFGISELRGIETVIAAKNQSITDQDLALVMQGLGVYWTNAGPPEDDEGNAAPLTISPSHVLEVPDGNSVGRLNGVSSVAPMIDHMKFMDEEVMSSRGLGDVATGMVDVAVAESGIALYLRLAPLLSRNSEREMAVISELDHFWYDILNDWLPNYEGIQTAGVKVKVTFRDPMPVNREKTITEVITLIAAGLITTDMAINKLTELGYEFPSDAPAQLLKEKKEKVAAETPNDPFADRAEEEARGGGLRENV